MNALFSWHLQKCAFYVHYMATMYSGNLLDDFFTNEENLDKYRWSCRN